MAFIKVDVSDDRSEARLKTGTIRVTDQPTKFNLYKQDDKKCDTPIEHALTRPGEYNVVLHIFQDSKEDLWSNLSIFCFECDGINKPCGMEHITDWHNDTFVRRGDRGSHWGQWHKFYQHLYLNGECPITIVLGVKCLPPLRALECRCFVEIHYLS